MTFKEYEIVYNRIIGEFLLEQRLAKRKTQEAVSKDLKVSRGAYSLYESGRRSIPMKLYIDVCEYYGINYVEEFERINKKADKELKKEVTDEK